jgi:hypothetical protein
MMPKTADILHRRIADYRKHLSEGVDADVAREYLNEIVKAEMKLRDLESREKKKPRSGG